MIYIDYSSEKDYVLKERTFLLVENVLSYVDQLPKRLAGAGIGQQFTWSAGLVGATYIEADEALSKIDFIKRIKICKKEAKESGYWIELSSAQKENNSLKPHLADLSTQLIKIFSTIFKNINL